MAWTKTSKNGYIILSESGLVLDDNESASAEVVTVTSAFPDGMNWENTKFPVTCEITTVAGAAVVVDAILQTSVNGVTTDDVMGATSATPSWADQEDIDINIASAAAANYSKECDASSVYAPYARLALKTAATDLTDGAGRCTISVAFKATNVPLEAADLANGVGADPS
tara:strand:+ start:49 stop:555 length:507 start_codon:yes stop_codon:yes gene_type:complete